MSAKKVKGPKIKARLMYAPHSLEYVHLRPCDLAPRPVYVLPADEAAYEAMVEQMAIAAFCEEHVDHTERTFYKREEWERDNYRDVIKSSLFAIGIKHTKGSK